MVKVLLPETIQPGNVRHATGVLAGRWIFATGRTTMPPLDDAAMAGPRLRAALERDLQALAPFVDYLCAALDLEF